MNDSIKIYRIYQYLESDTMKPVYTGQTIQELSKRAGGPNGCNYWSLKYFGPAIKKHGFDYFIPVIKKEVFTREEANYWEWYYTVKDNTQYPNGYNDSAGYKLSEQKKKRISEAHKGQPSPRKGKHHTEEAKQKNREKHLGKVRSLSSRKKQSETIKGHPGYNKGLPAHNKGKNGYTNGIKNVYAFECPEGFWPGITKRN